MSILYIFPLFDVNLLATLVQPTKRLKKSYQNSVKLYGLFTITMEKKKFEKVLRFIRDQAYADTDFFIFNFVHPTCHTT